MIIQKDLSEIAEDSLIKKNWRYSPVYRRWEKVIDYLMTKEWNGKAAYLSAYPKCKEKQATANFTILMNRPRFRAFFRYLQETKYGVNPESITAFWQKKMFSAKKEENALRASENLAKVSQLPGFRKEDFVQPNINIFVGFKKEAEGENGKSYDDNNQEDK